MEGTFLIINEAMAQKKIKWLYEDRRIKKFRQIFKQK
jgi:hypothetical protein